MATMEEYAKQPREQRTQRLTRTADELAAAIKGQSDAVLSRRPDAKNWAAKEIVCHLRDAEEAFGTRFEQILAMNVDPTLGGPSPDRLAEEQGGIHPVRGRITMDAFLSLMAWHDDNHLDQLTRALQGRA
jgi:hypothetical protein